jgi:hypothetical protein
MINFPEHACPPALPDLRQPVAVADLPPVDNRYHDEVRLELTTLVNVADQLGAQTFSLVDDEVTFTVPGSLGRRRWRGRLGAAGVVPV